MKFKEFKFFIFHMIIKYIFRKEMVRFTKLYKNRLFLHFPYTSYYDGKIDKYGIDKNTLYIDTAFKIDKIVFKNEGELCLKYHK